MWTDLAVNSTWPTCPNATNCTLPNLCSTVCSNDDVLGIGVSSLISFFWTFTISNNKRQIRVNFYVTMVLLAFVPRTPHTEELLNVLYANTGIAGLGLLITAVQQTASKELSLFHAIYVQHILFFLGIGVAPVGECPLVFAPLRLPFRPPTNTGKYNWTRSRIAMGVVIQFALIIAFTTWAVYVWARVEHFGSQPNLNDELKYVLMFVNIKATSSWLRGVWITTLITSAIVLVITFGINALALFAMRHDGEEAAGESEWYFFISIPQMMCVICFFPVTCSQSTT
jgi:magnesium-transporting ATPase (P-type)